jgi:hypothetical protein
MLSSGTNGTTSLLARTTGVLVLLIVKGKVIRVRGREGP